VRVEKRASEFMIVANKGKEQEFECRDFYKPDKRYKNVFWCRTDPSLGRLLAKRDDFEEANDAFWEYLESYTNRVDSMISIYNKQDSDVVDYNWLAPLQKVDVEFMTKPGNKLNCNEGGAGKTRELLALLGKTQSANALIICLRAGKYWWQKEAIQRIGFEAYVAEGHYQKRLQILTNFIAAVDSHKVLIINYDMLTDGNYLELLKKIKWNLCIVDEAHMLCGKKTDRIKGFKMIKHCIKKLVLATATPNPKRAYQIWQLLNLLDSKRFSSFWRFIDMYFELEFTTYSRVIGGVRKECLDEFQYMLAEFTTNRPKREIHPNIPLKEVIKVKHEMSDYQKYIQKELVENMEVDLQNGASLACPNQLVISIRLRQMLLEPALIGGKLSPNESPKTALILDLIEAHLLNDEKIVVFTWFNDYVEYLAKAIWNKFRTKPSLIYRETSDKDILAIQEKFVRDDKLKVIISTIGTGGTGTNLQAAHIGIMANKSTVPKDNLQAFERLDRPGQDTKVLFYDLVCEGSYEEAIDQLLDERVEEITAAMSLERLRKNIF